jgi:hypothetical protein
MQPPALPADAVSEPLEPGQWVTVTQQVQLKRWTTRVTGVIEAVEQRKTGSWFAHSKDDRLWLDRLVLRKADGEIVVYNLDRYSRVELVDGPEAGGASERSGGIETGDLSAGASSSGAGSHPAATATPVHGLAGGAQRKQPDADG